MSRRLFLVIVLVVLGMAGLALSQGTAPATDQSSAADTVSVKQDTPVSKADSTQAHKIVAYYFHGNVRCVSCKKIEAYTDEAIHNGFAGQLDGGQLEWRVVNIDEPENKHFIEDYQLYTKSVILSDMVDGKEARWKNLDKVWKLLGDKDAFMAYINEEVGAYLGTN